jgi:hypothetical protein
MDREIKAECLWGTKRAIKENNLKEHYRNGGE